MKCGRHRHQQIHRGRRIREIMGDDVKMITDGSPKALLSVYKDYQADILIAGGRNSSTPP